MLKRRINLKNELIAPLLDSLKKHLTLRENLKNIVHLENPWRHHLGGGGHSGGWMDGWRSVSKANKLAVTENA